MAGRTFKVCGCRDPHTGKNLGQKCPRLHRAGGGWSHHHGSWSYQLELPPHPDGRRRNPLRRSGYASQDAAEAEMGQAAELLAIAGDDGIIKGQIADLIVATVKTTKKLPDPEEVRRKVRTGQELEEDITVGQWLDRWLKGRKKLRTGTRTSYQTHINLYFKPIIGHIRLDKLRVHHVTAVFEAIDDLNDTILQARTSGDPKLLAKVKGRRVVSPATRQRIRATLRAALNEAIRQRFLDLNVASLVELESGKRPKALVWTPQRITAWQASRDTYIKEMKERHRSAYLAGSTRRKTFAVRALDAYIAAPRPSAVMVWTPEQTSIFLRRALVHRLYALFHLIASRGLRRGEGCGLRWPDLDLEDGSADIRWQITKVTGGTAQGQPKSDAGERQVQLDKDTTKILRAHKAQQNTERLAAGADWHDSGFVFTTETGQPLDLIPCRLVLLFGGLNAGPCRSLTYRSVADERPTSDHDPGIGDDHHSRNGSTLPRPPSPYPVNQQVNAPLPPLTLASESCPDGVSCARVIRAVSRGGGRHPEKRTKT